MAARLRIRAAVEDLVKRADELDDVSKRELEKALARVERRELQGAQNASLNLSLAAHGCDDFDLRERIEQVRRDLDELVF